MALIIRCRFSLGIRRIAGFQYSVSSCAVDLTAFAELGAFFITIHGELYLYPCYGSGRVLIVPLIATSGLRCNALFGGDVERTPFKASSEKPIRLASSLDASPVGRHFILRFVEKLSDLRKHSFWICHQNNMVCVRENRQL